MTAPIPPPGGIDAVNRDFCQFDQVDKSHTYRLSEACDGSEAFDEDFVVRTCDLSDYLHGDAAGRRRFAQSLGQAMEEIGFAILVGHGIDRDLFADAERATVELFETVSIAERMRYRACRSGSVNQGYFPIEQTTIIHPDLVEGWVFCRRAFDLDGDPDYRERDFWPRPGFEPRFRALV